MTDDKYGYVEHQSLEVEGFTVTDATSTGLRPHDALVWVGHGMEGKWLTPAKALELAAAIATVANGNIARRTDARQD